MNNVFRVAVVLLALSLSFALAQGCGGSGCTVGASSTCGCPDGRTGAQVCQADHTFGTCLCVGTGGGAGGSAGGVGGSGGSAGSSGGAGGSSGGPKRVFVTQTTYVGSAMGGLSGADQKCNLSAQSVGLGGTWVAWVSGGGNDAITRVTGNGPWVLVGSGTTVFNNKANLATTPLVPIDTSEQGTQFTSSTSVWTGTVNGGTASVDTCAAFGGGSYGTYGRGYSTASPNDWTNYTTALCGGSLHLYCFEL